LTTLPTLALPSRLLGHRTGSTTERYYNQARSLEASRLMKDYILALRHDLGAVNPKEKDPLQK